MRLFKITKRLPVNWFNRLHVTITAADDMQLGFIKTHLVKQSQDFMLSKRDRMATLLLIKYCEVREKWSKRKLNITTDHALEFTKHLS